MTLLLFYSLTCIEELFLLFHSCSRILAFLLFHHLIQNFASCWLSNNDFRLFYGFPYVIIFPSRPISSYPTSSLHFPSLPFPLTVFLVVFLNLLMILCNCKIQSFWCWISNLSSLAVFQDSPNCHLQSTSKAKLKYLYKDKELIQQT